MTAPPRADDPTAPPMPGPLQWKWIVLGVGLGILLVSPFLSIVSQPDRARTGALVVLLAAVLAGVLVGYRSKGETIRETAIEGFLLVALVGLVYTQVLGMSVSLSRGVMGLLVVPGSAMLGGWAGELLQGTLEEAHEDRLVDWPWVLVSVVLGFSLSAYAVLVGRELLGLGAVQSLWVFAGSFLITGWIVGYFSPGNTVIEPAIAGAMMVFLDSSFIFLWFEGLPITRILLVGFGAGIVLALVGSGIGEFMQRRSGKQRPAPDTP